MKRKLTALFPALLLGSLLLVSCDKDNDDDSGGGNSGATGSFSGDFTSGTTGEVTDWIASSATAVHNTDQGTITFALINSNGDRIDIKVESSGAGVNLFNNLSANVSTYNSSNDAVMPTATTWSDDFDEVNGGLFTIEEYDTLTNTIDATCTLLWHTIVEGGSNADALYGLIQNGVLTDIPVTVVVDDIFENDGTVSATVAGEIYTGTFVNATVSLGMNIYATSPIAGQSFTINLPKTAVSGMQEITMSDPFGYAVGYVDDGTAYGLETGTIDITNLNMVQGVAIGTFSGTFTPLTGSGDDIEITNGSFNIQ